MSSITLKDFQPINTWMLDFYGQKWPDGDPKYIIDMSTGKKYWNESKSCVGFKCFLLTLGTPIVHTIATLANVAYKIAKLVTLHHFWSEKEEKTYSYKERLNDAGKDLVKVVSAPITLLGLELAAVYGIFSPYNGRKLYASIEKVYYGNCILAPCFQPNPKYHALGGNPNKKNAY